MRISVFSVALSASALTAAVAADPTTIPAPPRQAGAEVADTMAILCEHRPTSGAVSTGVFGTQVGAVESLALLPHTNDVLTTAVEGWLPVVDGRMAVRLGFEVARTQFTQDTDIGLGDLQLGWRWAPQIAGPNGLLLALDTTWDTASRDRLGVQRHTVTPGVTYVLGGGSGLTFAPSLDYTRTWGPGDGADQSLTRMHGYVTWLRESTFWLQADPALNFDHENSDSWFALAVTGGIDLSKQLSLYATPAFAVGSDRPYDFVATMGVNVAF
jgi:hypothetical protein